MRLSNWFSYSNFKSSAWVFFKIYFLFLLTYVLWRYMFWTGETASINKDITTDSHPVAPQGLQESFQTDSVGASSAGAGAGTAPIEFMPAKTTAEFLLNDADKYVQSMSKADLHARKVICQEAYRLNAYFAAMDFSDTEKNHLKEAAAAADAFFQKYSAPSNTNRIGAISNTFIAYFDSRRAKAIPWKFMLVGDVYEEGLPHTRGEYILVAPSLLKMDIKELTETLVHEKVHLYQRKYKNEKTYLEAEKSDVFLTDYMVSKMGFTRVKRRADSACDFRANPDLDEWIYRDPKTQRDMILCYKSSQPTGIQDIIGNAKDEHPFEFIAYEIAKLLYVRES
jgi:hypothetical protein